MTITGSGHDDIITFEMLKLLSHLIVLMCFINGYEYMLTVLSEDDVTITCNVLLLLTSNDVICVL